MSVLSFRSSKSNCRQSTKPSPESPVSAESSFSSSRIAQTQRIDDTFHLSPQRKAEMLALMQNTEHQVVTSMMGDPETRTLWKFRMCKKGISYFVDDSVAKGLTRFCCVGHTNAPVSDIMEMFMVSNTEKLLKNVRIMYRNVKEAKILSVLQPATRSNPKRSVYIRYASFETPTPMKGRDICVCVCTNIINMADGSTVGYCLWDSVDIPECPDRFDSDNIIRSRMWHSGFFFRNSGKANDVTKVCYIIGVEIKGIAPELTGRLYMTIFGGNCRRVCQYYRKKLDPETFKNRSEWTPKNAAKTCGECKRGFNPLVKKHNCASCGDVVCSRCYFMEQVSVPGAVVTRARICRGCLIHTGMLGFRLQAIVVRNSGSGVSDLLRDDSTSTSSCSL
ncbi:hypothetical protein PHMEG_00012836 [Phytophthora megakarya]|uniref:FYVE-type domain-containing protein n=1 Tax=Phytophthora megakarya TaxID=4795 RepID=A0A225W889_9STRA|nr:hypothetical protein PHMEG_00012836 [Phytophthora megakarya]